MRGPGSVSGCDRGRPPWRNRKAGPWAVPVRWAHRLLLVVCAAAVLPGCSLLRTPERVVTAVVPVEKGKHPDPIDLQVQVQRFADDYSSQIASAVDDFARRVGTESARVQGLKWKLAATTAAVSIASGPRPKANLLDLVSLAVLNHTAVVDLRQTHPNGPALQPWIEASSALETNAWALAAANLPPAQVAELRDALDDWQARNPGVRNLFAARPQEFTSMVKASQPRQTDPNSVFSMVGLDPTAGLDPAVHEVTLTRLFAERALYVLQRMPLLVRWQTELLGENLALQPGVQMALTNAARLGDSLDRISHAAESASQTAAELPDRIATERQAVLAALDQQEGKLRDLAAEVNRSLVSAQQMSDSLNTTIGTFDALMKRFGVGEPRTETPPATNSAPFNILDYAHTADQIGGMAKDLNTLIASVNQSVPELERLGQQAGTDVQRVIDRGFRLGLVLVGVLLVGAVLAGLAYRLLAHKLDRAGSPPPRVPPRPGVS